MHILQNARWKGYWLVHRDIKPSNIMLDKAGVIKIVDFGVSLGDEMKDLKHGFVVLGDTCLLSRGKKR